MFEHKDTLNDSIDCHKADAPSVGSSDLLECRNFGNKVIVWFEPKSSFPNMQEYRNVTELHFNFMSPIENQLAIESDIHGTGIVLPMNCIKEFETCLEIDKANAF